ncbi:MAG: S8 family serine peptidase, partial [Candidatus Korarchaeota archaeon]|nr:S8 family serine peptidase [Candidatus Korarchaeota archaeon]
DNDFDGLVDEDPVETAPPCADDDGDGLINEDPAGIDNDGDGRTTGAPSDDEMEGGGKEDPPNYGDHDGDGLLDEDGMSDDAACGLPDLDGDGFWYMDDDDDDGLFDEDPVNGADDDFDGLVDEDPAGRDNDGDGLVDEDTEIWPDFVGKVKALIDATEWWGYTGDGSAEDFWFHGTHVSETAVGLGTSMWGKYGGAGAGYYWPPIPGVAPGADLAMVRFFGDQGSWEVNYQYVDEWSAYAMAHRSTGAYINSNSWGYPSGGEYSLYEAYWDLFAKGGVDWDLDGDPEPPMVCVFAAGNDGPDPTVSLDGPGIAKNVIQVGATTNPPFFTPNQFAYFSSRGPTADGRIKPDVVAPGYYVAGPMTGMYMYGWLTPDPVQGLHVWAAGTSMATPQVAGAAALWEELFSFAGTLSPTAVKALIVNFADWMGYDPTADSDGNGNPDLYDMGFGQLNFYNWFTHPGVLYVCDECMEVSGGWFTTIYFVVEDPSVPLRVTLTWADPPQWAPGVPALINDFDLQVIAPDGTTYNGNDLTPSYDDQRDGVNNVERVVIETPMTGKYTIRVWARSTPMSDPPFTLVVFGNG